MPLPALIALLPALLAGFGLGVLFFTGLWFTVRALPRSSHPLLLMVGSAVLRLAALLPALALLAGNSWLRLGAALLGFLLARTLLILRWRPVPEA
ncbi:MAG: ATP synthase subunit I [Synechococcaceae cyanobacterium]|nr:ATP synthase subunit I [Synechococcaceae cyanobacterium]